MAKVMEKNHVIFVGSETPDLVHQMHMIPAEHMDQAFHIATEKLGRNELDVLIVPHALMTLPLVSQTP